MSLTPEQLDRLEEMDLPWDDRGEMSALVAMARKLLRLQEKIETIVPYVTATLHGLPTDERDWIRIHRGRANSSERQLNYLLKDSKEKSV